MTGRTSLVGLLAVTVAAGCTAPTERQSALEPAGAGAAEVFELGAVLLGLGTLVAVVVIGLLLYAMKGARSAEPSAEGEARRYRWIGVGVGATLAILVTVFVLSLLTGRATESAVAGPGALTVEVTGYRFWWEVRYPDADPARTVVTANQMHLPLDRPVRIRVRTADVIHSFWIPNLHGKIDMIPGRTNEIVVRAREAGVFRGACAEFCGIQHANMAFMVVVQPSAEFDAWRARAAAPAPEPADSLASRGRQAFMDAGCGECHGVRGTPADGAFGPDLTHVASRLTLGAGMIPNTRGHLGGWITNPQQVKPGNNMPAVPLTGEELRAMLHYLETLR